MKMVILLFFPIYAFSMDCRIDGSIDAPQRMNCCMHSNMQIELLDVECRDGQYQISWLNKTYDVDMAYLAEDESGLVPIVFQGRQTSFKAKDYQYYLKGDLEIDGSVSDGLCFKN